MRFKDIEKFDVTDLHLDQGNYRFKKADDQVDCIRRIYLANPAYFKGLMQSIAEDDIGEPLLVYKTEEENIVLDGNRRLAALKALSNDEFLPNENLKNYADQLRNTMIVDLTEIQAQVSSDKKLIMKTVYERHAGGKTGKARIAWNAYAAARFSYFEEMGDNHEWHFVALLTRTEEDHPNLTEYLDSNKFSYETFRRLIREAFKRGLISKEIFSGRNKRIKTTAAKNLIDDAIAKTLKLLDAMEKREVSLSRGESFADKETVEKFFDNFTLSPDAQQIEDAKNIASQKNHQDGNTLVSLPNDNQNSIDCLTEGSPGNPNNLKADNDILEEANVNNKPSAQIGIIKSSAIDEKLKKLASKKLIGLYGSLCKVSLDKNPELMYVGAWSFFEVLSKLTGNTNPNTTNTPDFPSFFRNKMKEFKVDAAERKDWGNTLDIISKYGNATKHSQNTTPVTALQLRHDFETLEPFILSVIDQAILLKNNKAV